MAEITRGPVLAVDEGYAAPRSGLPRISWGAIFAGAVAALGLWLMLYSFGLAVGLTALDPDNPGSLKSSGVFTGIWGLVSPLVALFVGGVVAGRGAGLAGRGEAAVHGLVMWGLATVVGAFLVIAAVAAVIRGVASVGQVAVHAGGAAFGAGEQRAPGAGAIAERLGIDADDVLGPVNRRLEAAGLPPIRPEQLEAATAQAIQRAVREGRGDHDMLVQAIAQNTALPRAEAEEIASRIEMQIENARDRASARAQTAQAGVIRAVEASGKAFWGVFGALLLGLIAAVIGAALGVPHLHGRRRESVAMPAPGGPPTAPREVFP
jgi:hypothetical protein